MTTTPPKPPECYELFRSTADLTTWAECAHLISRDLAHCKSDDLGRTLFFGLTVTAYFCWLARNSGDSGALAHAETLYDSLLMRLRRNSKSFARIDLDRCWGVALGYQGYSKRARLLLIGSKAMTLENCLLVVEGDEEKAAAAIRPLLGDRGATTFLPAIHFYGAALVNIGALSEATDLAAHSGWSSDQPLLLEIVGAAHERLGQWQAAHSVYRRSSWPGHRYRAAILEGIIAAKEGISRSGKFEVDRPMAEIIGEPRSEMSQREVSRSLAFLNACAWSDRPDWLAELELGKISFAQRRFVEADIHLHRALELGPKEAAFAIARLRWVNLTWLTGGGAFTVGLDMVPEALTAAWLALEAASSEDETSEIRIWAAQQSQALGLIPTDLEKLPPARRAEAYNALGDRGKAVDCRIEQLASSYDHRAIIGLIKTFGFAGFELTVERLAEIVLEQSSDDFFVLWETATELESTLPGGSAAEDGSGTSTTLDRFRERLVDLSRLDYKNALRCHEFLMQIGDDSAATEVLRWATEQADGVSELVALAQLRHLENWESGAPALDVQGLTLLDRASRRARDRLERLLIARGLFDYGQVRAGRAALERERVFETGESVALSPIEATVVLGCRRWLSPQECEGVASRAADRLDSDARSGRLGKLATKAYVDRLCDAVGDPTEPIAQAIRTRLDTILAAEEAPDDWPGPDLVTDEAINSMLSALSEDDDDSGADEAINSMLSNLSEDHEDSEADEARIAIAAAGNSFGLRLIVAGELRSQLQMDLDAVMSTGLTAAGEDLPAAADYRGDAVRTLDLCEVWRSLIVAGESDRREAERRLHEFFEDELVLETTWMRARTEARAPELRRVIRTAISYTEWLAVLVAGQDDHGGHPILRDLLVSIREDVARLRDETAQELASARRELRAVVLDHSTP